MWTTQERHCVALATVWQNYSRRNVLGWSQTGFPSLSAISCLFAYCKFSMRWLIKPISWCSNRSWAYRCWGALMRGLVFATGWWRLSGNRISCASENCFVLVLFLYAPGFVRCLLWRVHFRDFTFLIVMIIDGFKFVRAAGGIVWKWYSQLIF